MNGCGSGMWQLVRAGAYSFLRSMTDDRPQVGTLWGAPVRVMSNRQAACARELLCPRCRTEMRGLTAAGLLGAECSTCRSVYVQPVGTA